MVRKNKLFIASDHRGYRLKTFLLSTFPLIDVGPFSDASVDYNDFAKFLVEKMTPEDQGILICYSGLGMSMAANRNPKARAALTTTPDLVKLAREHNDANILVLPGTLESQVAKNLVEIFLETPFSNQARHRQRVEKLSSC
jgi:ribose 5-phosphate isomerase B